MNKFILAVVVVLAGTILSEGMVSSLQAQATPAANTPKPADGTAEANRPIVPGSNPAAVYPANPGTVATTTTNTSTTTNVSDLNPGTSKPNATNPGVPGAMSSNPNNPGTIPTAAVPATNRTDKNTVREHSGSNPGLNPGTTQHRHDPGLNPGTTTPRTYPKLNPGTTTPRNEPKLNPGQNGGPGGSHPVSPGSAGGKPAAPAPVPAQSRESEGKTSTTGAK